MNKYKVGDKFIIEIEEVFEDDMKSPYRMKRKGCAWIAEEKILDQLPQLVQGVDTACYNKGAEEAWKTAIQILFDDGISNDELAEIFGTRFHYKIMKTFTPQEAKAKIDEWKKAKEEIKVGDIISCKRTSKRSVVTKVNGRFLDVLYEDGAFWRVDKNLHEKTGERIDIETVLKQLGGN